MVRDINQTASLMTPEKLAQFQAGGVDASGAWLEQMGVDVGRAQVMQLDRLQRELLAQALGRDDSLLFTHLESLAAALPQLDFTLVQTRGWWARTTGKSKIAADTFASQFRQCVECSQNVAEQISQLHQRRSAQAPHAERVVIELKVEYEALRAMVEHGERWLGDKRAQLRERMAGGTDVQAQQGMKNDAARYDSLVGRMNALRAASTAAQKTLELVKVATAQRVALQQLLQNALKPDMSAWQVRVASLAAALADADDRTPGVEVPKECHSDLQQRVVEVRLACERLREAEATLTLSLATLESELKALGAN